MADQIPIKVMKDGSDNTCGLAQFIATDTVGTIDGGTGLATQGICAFAQPGINAVACKTTYIGICAGKSEGAADENTYVGYGAGQNVTTGCYHTIIGSNAGDAITTCSFSTLIGYNAGTAITFGERNTAIGSSAGAGITTGDDNTLVGYVSGTVTTGNNNTGLGACTLAINTVGVDNVVIGSLAGKTQVAAGCNNTYIGSQAGEVALCRDNTLVGAYAGTAQTTATCNVMLGGCVGYGVVGGAGNVYLGYKSGLVNTSGNDNVFIGKSSGVGSTASCCLIIGNGTCDIITGSFNTPLISMVGCVGIGTATPSTNLEVYGDVQFGDTAGSQMILNVGTASYFDIRTATSDGADSSQLRIGGGGDVSFTRGATIEMIGNEHTNTGELRFYAGCVSGGDIRLYTKGTERLTVEYGGNVGIGTAVPGASLNIADSGSFLIGHGTLLEMGGDTPALQVAGTANADAQIGIMRSNAGVSGSILTFSHTRDALGTYSTVLSENDATGQIRFSGSDGTDAVSFTAYITSYVDGTVGANDMPGRLVFSTSADGSQDPTERMRIDSSGNVGIGTDAPDGELHVMGGSAGSVTAYAYANELVVENDDDAGISILGPSVCYQQVVFGSPDDNHGAQIRWNHDDDLFTIGTANAGASLRFNVADVAEAMRIDSSGNVGIGTTAPGNALDVDGAIVTIGANTANEANVGKLSFEGSNVVQLAAWGTDTSTGGILKFRTKSSDSSINNDGITIDGSGNVGIGTTVPDGKLHIRSGTGTFPTPHADHDELIIENTNDAGISIITCNAYQGGIAVGDTDQNRRGYLIYDNGTSLNGQSDTWSFGAATAQVVTISCNKMFICDTTNADMVIGLTIKGCCGSTSYDDLFTLKADTVSTPFTSSKEADTFFDMAPWTDDGGLYFRAWDEGSRAYAQTALNFDSALGGTSGPSTTCTSSSRGVENHRTFKSDGGTSSTGVAGGENAYSWQAGGTTIVLWKADGSLFAADTDWATGFDDIPDAIAARAYTTERGMLTGYKIYAPDLVQRMEDEGIVTHVELPGEGTKPGHRFLNTQKGIKFSWDMGFQNLKWLHEVTKVLTTKQRKQLPAEMQSAFAYLEN